MRTIHSLLIGAISLALWGCQEAAATIGNDTPKSNVLAVDYVIVYPKSIANEIRVTGTLVAAESAMLSTQSAGLVQEIHFREGQFVKKGQLLLQLDDRQLIAQRKKLEAQLETAKRDVVRNEQLLEIQGISQAEVDDAKLLVATLEADLQELAVRIDFATIKAPFSGQIGLRNISPGAYLAAGAPVAQLVQNDPLRLEFNVPERYADQIRNGQPVRFTISGSDATYEARVYATDPVISEATRSLRIRARVPNQRGELLAGAFAEIELTLDSIPDALLVPTDAVVPQLNDQIVYRIQRDTIQQVIVQAGIRLTNQVQIETGLAAGDTIMVSGLLQARHGLPVRAEKEITLELLSD